VRLIITLCSSAVLCAIAGADTIVLKNGDRIVADSVQESDGRVRYTIGDNSFALPKSIVVKIETGPAAAPALAPAAPLPAMLPQPSAEIPISGLLLDKLIHNGVMDTDALRAIEREGNAEQSGAAYSIAARFAEDKRDFPSAARYLESALRFIPRQPVLLENYASVLLNLGRTGEALAPAQLAASVGPSADTYAVLGFVYYRNGRTREAVAALKRSLQLRSDDGVRRLLDQMEHESRTEADFREQESNHFIMRYEGSEVADALRSQILETLEDGYKTIDNDLGGSPRNIYVSLYTDQAYFDVTRAPSWSTAINDGKIRVPISGLKAVTPELSGTLRHELTHSFIRLITHERCPGWLNEGIAQLEEGRSTGSIGNRLAALYASGHQIPLNQLEGRFDIFSRDEASVAYAESLAAAEYIRTAYGMPSLAQILQRLGQGQPVESALRATVHVGYAELESEIADYLKKNYGT
jgi:tetratricopeptide (TPR) repeat protein